MSDDLAKQTFGIYRHFARIARGKGEYDLCICGSVDRLFDGFCPTCWAKREIDTNTERSKKEQAEGKRFQSLRAMGLI